MAIRHAQQDDFDEILAIYSHAREQMRLMGNPSQWGTDKPSEETIRTDIARGQAYVVTAQDRLCGVFAFIIGDDPTYRTIEDGAWPNDAPYGTIHRIAGNGRSGRVFAQALDLCERQIRNIRIDTHDDNKIMQHLLREHGFVRCGRIYVEDGTPRTAYQKTVRGPLDAL